MNWPPISLTRATTNPNPVLAGLPSKGGFVVGAKVSRSPPPQRETELLDVPHHPIDKLTSSGCAARAHHVETLSKPTLGAQAAARPPFRLLFTAGLGGFRSTHAESTVTTAESLSRRVPPKIVASRCRKPTIVDRRAAPDTEASQGDERFRPAILFSRALGQRRRKGEGHRTAPNIEVERAVSERQIMAFLTTPPLWVWGADEGCYPAGTLADSDKSSITSSGVEVQGDSMKHLNTPERGLLMGQEHAVTSTNSNLNTKAASRSRNRRPRPAKTAPQSNCRAENARRSQNLFPTGVR